MTFTCKLQAFGEESQYRAVEVPDTEVYPFSEPTLEAVFGYGQNDMQPREVRSLSVGDLIGAFGLWWLVESAGFSPTGPLPLEFRPLSAEKAGVP